MNTQTSQARQTPRHRSRWLAGVVLFVAGGVSGGLVAGAMTAQAHGDMRSLWRHQGHGGAHYSVERARERAADTAAWVVGTVDASDEQKTSIRQIMARTVDTVYPLVAQHRDNRQEFIELLARADLDDQALEALRQSELRLIDDASQQLSGALTEVSKVLTSAQRQQLLALAAKMRRHR